MSRRGVELLSCGPLAGQNNLTSTQVVNAASAAGQNNLNSSVTPIFFGSGLANASLFKK